MEWNMEVIGDVIDSIKETLKDHGIKVCHPIVTGEDGSRRIEEFD